MLRTCLLTAILLGLLSTAAFRSGETAPNLATYASSLISTFDDDQKVKALMPYESEQRTGWHFIPKKTRKGLTLGEMNDAQRTAALRLVRAALSETGYDKTRRIMGLETVLRQLEGEDRNWPRDSQLYYMTLFGDPAADDRWAMSFEGHHVSLNFVVRDGKVVDSTPQFLASNPAIIKTANDQGYPVGSAVLYDEEQLGFELINDLAEEQRQQAVIAANSPPELRFAGISQPEIGEPEGLPYTRMNDDQRKLLRRLVMLYVDVASDDIADNRRDVIAADGWDDVHFGWAGASEPGIGHYYRIQGKSFLIELVNSAPDPEGNVANHLHSNLRDLTGDFDLPITR